MKQIIVFLILALVPTLIGFWVLPRYKRRFQASMRRIRGRYHHPTPMNSSHLNSSYPLAPPPPPERYEHFIGDLSCYYNAHSPHLRCAVNPSGPCEGCPYYEPKE